MKPNPNPSPHIAITINPSPTSRAASQPVHPSTSSVPSVNQSAQNAHPPVDSFSSSSLPHLPFQAQNLPFSAFASPAGFAAASVPVSAASASAAAFAPPAVTAHAPTFAAHTPVSVASAAASAFTPAAVAAHAPVAAAAAAAVPAVAAQNKPFMEDALKLASHAYRPDDPTPAGYTKLTPAQIGARFGIRPQLLVESKAQFYTHNASNHVVVSFPGSALPIIGNTQHAHAFHNNVSQAIGLTPGNYDAAYEIGSRLGRNGHSVTFVGHSQGGGLASVAGAWAQDANLGIRQHVMTVNPAAPNPANMPRGGSRADQTNYVQHGDPVNQVNVGSLQVPGDTIRLTTPEGHASQNPLVNHSVEEGLRSKFSVADEMV